MSNGGSLDSAAIFLIFVNAKCIWTPQIKINKSLVSDRPCFDPAVPSDAGREQGAF